MQDALPIGDADRHPSRADIVPGEYATWPAPLRLTRVSSQYKARVRADALQLQQKNPTLRLSAGEIVHNDGTRASLIMLDGTIPMFSGGVKYNAPVAIYIVYNFPEACPLVYVRPVAGAVALIACGSLLDLIAVCLSIGMMIRPGHPFVDNSGLTTDPYLTSWRASTSTLSGLVDALTRSFSASPPVYSIPAPLAPGQPSAYGAATNTAHSGYAVAYSANAGYGGGASPAYQPPTVGSVTAVTRAVAASSVSRKDDLVARVTARLQEEMTLYYSRCVRGDFIPRSSDTVTLKGERRN